MFSKLLIANRGEIAARVIRTARRLGVQTVAIYSEADRDARHTRLADEAYCVGPPPALQSYLDAGAILAVAERAGADAVHPGYGFLAENAVFAERCAERGLAFVGPPAAAMRRMGEKKAALATARAAGVPVLPSSTASERSDDELRGAAERIGYPVVVKPNAGGGGKGMRLVTDACALPAALAASRREARSAFGDACLLVEKYLARARHIEVQVFADQAGNAVHLFERDCSIQRRHQKIMEESPAPHLAPALRAALYDAAVRVCLAIGYVGAGTVEFLVECRESPEFYFLEMNTRLQVEHPVTELVTGQDLVEWQLRVAAGEKLPSPQPDLNIRGHAVQARVYAEDPERGFLPLAGRVRRLRLPREGSRLRVDAGVDEGEEVTIHYDPLLFKIIACGETRNGALDALSRALLGCVVEGVNTNLDLLAGILVHPVYRSGSFDTRFIVEFQADLLGRTAPVPDDALAIACLYVLLERERTAREQALRSADPHSPWHTRAGWRLNACEEEHLEFADPPQALAVRVQHRSGHYRLTLPGGAQEISGRMEADGTITVRFDARTVRAAVTRSGDALTVRTARARWALTLGGAAVRSTRSTGGRDRLITPMPGRILTVHVAVGDRVRRGDPLLVVEAMKMEHTVAAPWDGTVARVNFKVGDQVASDAELAVIEPQPSEGSSGTS